MMGLMSIYASMGEGNGYIKGAIIGGGLLGGIAFSLPGIVMIHGICISYLQAKEGVDFSGEQAKIESGINQAKEKASQAKLRAEQLNQREPSIQPQTANTRPEKLHSCPKCKATLSAEDLFCGECGYKL